MTITETFLAAVGKVLPGVALGTVTRERTPESVVFEEEAIINGDIGCAWSMLSDLPSYARWNPWLVSASGTLLPGGVVWADVVLGEKRVRAKHVVLEVEPNARLFWRDAGWSNLFAYGQRRRTLEALPDGKVRLRQELIIDGPFRNVVRKKFGAALRVGLAAETKAVKQGVESASARAS